MTLTSQGLTRHTQQTRGQSHSRSFLFVFPLTQPVALLSTVGRNDVLCRLHTFIHWRLYILQDTTEFIRFIQHI